MTRPRRRRPHYGTKVIGSRGGSRQWTRWTAEFVSLPGNQICWLRFPKCTIRATSIDHYWPISTHPHLAESPSNWRPTCRYCNTARRHTPPHLIEKLRTKLEREFARRNKPRKALGFFG